MKEDYLEIGKSGIYVPYLGMGTWAIGGGKWWGDNDDELSVRTILEAVDLGIAWIDTAPIYGLYHSEEVVGKAIKECRSKVVLSTKCGLEWGHQTPIFHKNVDGTDVYRDLSKKNIIAELEHSLKNLGTDYIDVYYTHWQSPDQKLYPIEETMDALMTLKKQGKIRAIGASNVDETMIREYCKYGQLDVIQEKYSIATRKMEYELASVCKELGISMQAYSPLEQGLLTGKATMETSFPEGSVRNNNPSWQPKRRAKILGLLDNWKKYKEKYHCSYANLIIALTSEMMEGLHVLGGARKPEQIRDNAKALELKLEDADVAAMKKEVDLVL
jgi:methylglyoxal reductase